MPPAQRGGGKTWRDIYVSHCRSCLRTFQPYHGCETRVAAAEVMSRMPSCHISKGGGAVMMFVVVPSQL